MDKGVVYLASGTDYVDQAKHSAESVKQHNPDLHITLFTDEYTNVNVFDNITQINRPIQDMGDSILSDSHFPYELNLYLDVDTFVSGSLSSLFKLLEKYDIAVSHNAGGKGWNKTVYNNMNFEIPACFPEFNSGVIAYRDSDSVRELFSKWNKFYEDISYESVDYLTNQPALRLALYQSDVDHVAVPPEYNFQTRDQRSASDMIRIVHNTGGITQDMDFYSFVDTANSTESPRSITLEDYPCRALPAGYRSPKYRIMRLIKNERIRKRLLSQARIRWEQGGLVGVIKYLTDRGSVILKNLF